MQNQLLGQHIRPRLSGDANQPGNHPGAAGNNPQLFLPAFSCQNPHCVDFLVLQEGEGLPPAYRCGRGQGRYFGIKVPLQLAAFPAPQLLKVYQTDAIALQMLHQLGIDGVLAAVQPGHGFPDGLNLLLGGHMGLIVSEILT